MFFLGGKKCGDLLLSRNIAALGKALEMRALPE
jgi:hypothetical protein